MFSEIVFFSSFFISSASCSEFDTGYVILFQIKVFSRKIKETALARYFIKATVRPSFTWFRIIGQINEVH